MPHVLITSINFNKKLLANDGNELQFRLFKHFGKNEGKGRVVVRNAEIDGQLYLFCKDISPEQLQTILKVGESMTVLAISDENILSESAKLFNIAADVSQALTLYSAAEKVVDVNHLFAAKLDGSAVQAKKPESMTFN